MDNPPLVPSPRPDSSSDSLFLRLKNTIHRNRLLSILIGLLVLIMGISAVVVFAFDKNTKTTQKDSLLSPSPSPQRKKISPTKKPSSSFTFESKVSPTIQATAVPTAASAATSAPTATPQSATNTPAPTATPTPQPPDTSPPSITNMTGPEDGSTINFNNFCFPMNVSDDRSKYPNIQVQHKFDSADWTGWGTDVSPCFNNVANGQHTFSVHAKDEAGNTSSTITRTFTVQVN